MRMWVRTDNIFDHLRDGWEVVPYEAAREDDGFVLILMEHSDLYDEAEETMKRRQRHRKEVIQNVLLVIASACIAGGILYLWA